jgi:site-specific recombinase XerD
MHTSGFAFDNVLEGLSKSEAVFKGSKTRRAYAAAGHLFVRYLQAEGLVAKPPAPQTALEKWPIIAEYRKWAHLHRGVKQSTLDLWQCLIVDFLSTLGEDPKAYTAAALRSFIQKRRERYRIGTLKNLAGAIRAFLKFLVARGACPAGREHAIPSIADWKLASIPRHLAPDQVERVIAACNNQRRLRDKAIVLLLARLGLRASEAANLHISDIDWKSGKLAVYGKSGHTQWLPLPQEVGDAIIAYLKRARPKVRIANLFLTESAPTRPITRIAVKCIANRALDRAGIESEHRGAHVLRHSAATTMLRRGVSLSGVCAVLRHASPDMTMHYAKVDFALLSEVAQPWAGRLPC